MPALTLLPCGVPSPVSVSDCRSSTWAPALSQPQIWCRSPVSWLDVRLHTSSSPGRSCCPHRPRHCQGFPWVPPLLLRALGVDAVWGKLCVPCSGLCLGRRCLRPLSLSPVPVRGRTCSGNTVSQQLLGAGFPRAPCARAIALALAANQQQSGAKDLQTKGFSLFVINVVQLN